MKDEELQNKKEELKKENKTRLFIQKHLKNLLGDSNVYNKSQEEVEKEIDEKLENEEDRLVAKETYKRGRASKEAVDEMSPGVIKGLKGKNERKKEIEKENTKYIDLLKSKDIFIKEDNGKLVNDIELKPLSLEESIESTNETIKKKGDLNNYNRFCEDVSSKIIYKISPEKNLKVVKLSFNNIKFLNYRDTEKLKVNELLLKMKELGFRPLDYFEAIQYYKSIIENADYKRINNGVGDAKILGSLREINGRMQYLYFGFGSSAESSNKMTTYSLDRTKEGDDYLCKNDKYSSYLFTPNLNTDIPINNNLENKDLKITESVEFKPFSNYFKNIEELPKEIQEYLDLKENKEKGEHFEIKSYGDSKNTGYGMSYYQGVKIFYDGKEVKDSGLKLYRSGYSSDDDDWGNNLLDFKIMSENSKNMQYGYSDGNGNIHIVKIDKDGDDKDLKFFNKRSYENNIKSNKIPNTLEEFNEWVKNYADMDKINTKTLLDNKDYSILALIHSYDSTDDWYRLFFLRKGIGIAESKKYYTNGKVLSNASFSSNHLRIMDIVSDEKYKEKNVLNFETSISGSDTKDENFLF